MVFLKRSEYAALVRDGATAEALAARVVALEARNEKLLDAVLAMKQAGAELPPGFGEEGFGAYTFDDVEQEEVAMDAGLQPGLQPPEGEDPELLADVGRLLRL